MRTERPREPEPDEQHDEERYSNGNRGHQVSGGPPGSRCDRPEHDRPRKFAPRGAPSVGRAGYLAALAARSSHGPRYATRRPAAVQLTSGQPGGQPPVRPEDIPIDVGPARPPPLSPS